MQRPLDLKRLTAIALGILAVWVALGIFFASQHHTQVLAYYGSDDLLERRVGTITGMLVWAVLTPFVLYVAERFPLRPPLRVRNALILTPLMLALAAGRALLDRFLPVVMEGTETAALAHERHYLWATFHTHLLFAVLLVGIANFLRLQRDIAERRQREARFAAELAQARLRRLRADLHPHFLFNSLNAVAALLHTDAARAERMLATLTELLRRSVASEDALEVPLADELDFLEKYLDVQRTRYGERLQTRIVVTDRRFLGASIAPLLLQPLVENAILHGVAPRDGGGSVTIHVSGDDDWLRIEVQDDGPGADTLSIFGSGHVGVRNVAARLQSTYGEAHSLTFRHADGGFVAEVAIPRRGVSMRRAS